jgi:hypothetical protein
LLVLPYSQAHTAKPTAQQKMAANPPTNILYKKNYNMPYAIFAAIICFGLTHAPESNWDLQDLTKGKTANAVSSFVAHPPPYNETVFVVNNKCFFL